MASRKVNEPNVTLTVSMSQKMLDDISEIARDSGLTRSAVVVSLLIDALAEKKTKQEIMKNLPDILQQTLEKSLNLKVGAKKSLS